MQESSFSNSSLFNSCILCAENHSQYYQICDCGPNKVCHNCYEKFEQNSIQVCPWCRGPLIYRNYFDNKKRKNDLFFFFSFLTVKLIVEFIFPIILINTSKHNLDNENFLYNKQSLYILLPICVFSIQAFNNMLINILSGDFSKQMLKTYEAYVCYYCFLLYFIYSISQPINLVYLIIVLNLMPSYIIVMGVLLHYFIYLKIENLVKYYDIRNYQMRRLTIVQLLE